MRIGLHPPDLPVAHIQQVAGQPGKLVPDRMPPVAARHNQLVLQVVVLAQVPFLLNPTRLNTVLPVSLP